MIKKTEPRSIPQRKRADFIQNVGTLGLLQSFSDVLRDVPLHMFSERPSNLLTSRILLSPFSRDLGKREGSSPEKRDFLQAKFGSFQHLGSHYAPPGISACLRRKLRLFYIHRVIWHASGGAKRARNC